MTNTIGIIAVAGLGASDDGPPPVAAITANPRCWLLRACLKWPRRGTCKSRNKFPLSYPSCPEAAMRIAYCGRGCMGTGRHRGWLLFWLPLQQRRGNFDKMSSPLGDRMQPRCKRVQFRGADLKSSDKSPAARSAHRHHERERAAG